MSDRTRIAWANSTWNPIAGCSPIGAGCQNCYAKRMAQRLKNMGNPFYRGVVVKGLWNGTTAIAHADIWNAPKKWRKPRRIFVCSMGDLFHHTVSDETIECVADVARDCPQHKFLWLTKRNGRMVQHLREHFAPGNVWAGISASTNAEADKACCALNELRGTLGWLSLEPLIEPVTLFRTEWKPGRTGHCFPSWVVIGCESGPNKRPCSLKWVDDLVGECRDAGVPCFVKQLNLDNRVSRDPSEWPKELRVQEWPE